jgi:uroporphyrinogen decarboxylase
MKPRERVFAALKRQIPDRVPRFEIWIEALLPELGQRDPQDAYVNLGQDCIMLPGRVPAGSNAWQSGVDEWGRVWNNGMYAGGVVATKEDLRRYSPPLTCAPRYFDETKAETVKNSYPDHCLIYGSHIGPFTAAYLAMGMENFFMRMLAEPAFVCELLESRTEWCIALFKVAAALGAEALVLGDDAGHSGGPMISPRMWREFVLPHHRKITEAVDVPVIWHSDGNILPLLPMAIDAGFAGIHGLEPGAGVELTQAKREFGKSLALVGNIDVRVLCRSDLEAVRSEVDRCIRQGAPGGGYMISTCNSIFSGMNPACAREMFRYEGEVGFY